MLYLQIGTGEKSILKKCSENGLLLGEMYHLLEEATKEQSFPMDCEAFRAYLDSHIKDTKVSWYGLVEGKETYTRFIFHEQHDSAIDGASYTKEATFELLVPNSLLTFLDAETSKK